MGLLRNQLAASSSLSLGAVNRLTVVGGGHGLSDQISPLSFNHRVQTSKRKLVRASMETLNDRLQFKVDVPKISILLRKLGYVFTKRSSLWSNYDTNVQRKVLSSLEST